MHTVHGDFPTETQIEFGLFMMRPMMDVDEVDRENLSTKHEVGVAQSY